MNAQETQPGACGIAPREPRAHEFAGVLLAVAGLVVLSAQVLTPAAPAGVAQHNDSAEDVQRRVEFANGDARHRDVGAGRQWQIGGYGGVAHTHRSEVHIKNEPQTDMTASGFDWIGRPFKAPIYYGLRGITWSPASRVGGMIDFTHAKAIAAADDIATFTGTRDGKPMPPKARVRDVFRHLEFSHGHNMVTLNGLLSLMPDGSRIRPYIGAGAGISLPHTEVGFKDVKERTYEYQFAGFVGQTLAGVEIPLGRVSVFLEYKFSYAPYEVPLSHEPYGWVLVTDLWRQFTAWWQGEKPPGGILRTTLATHHAIGGVLFRVP